MRRLLGALLALLLPAAALAQNAAITDPPRDAAHPPQPVAFVLKAPDGAGAMNALLWQAGGAGAHPTLLLFHGFPGNEQNLDLAQAARRAGWHVLTLHYRGSWGSPGTFSFTHAAEDAHTALAWLRARENAARYGIDPRRIAVAGHSMGGFMAADAAADDPAVVGLFLIDAWWIGKYGAQTATPAGLTAWRAGHAEDMPPLAGATLDGLAAEARDHAARFDLAARVLAYGKRPLAIYGATEARGADNLAVLNAAVQAGNTKASGGIWDTDHSFSDHRVALSTALVEWLGTLEPAR
jgi:pimeloyl-ACP methyl ester carboxylesterase